MEYDLNKFVTSFAERTLRNQRVIDAIYKGREYKLSITVDDDTVYEVTQLLNSLFGIFIIPYEVFKPHKAKDYKKTHDSYQRTIIRFKEANQEAFNEIEEIIRGLEKNFRLLNTYKYDKQYNTDKVLLFIEHIRNSLAHGGDGGLHFFPISVDKGDDKPKSIESIIFRDHASDEDFVAELTIEEIRKFVNQLNEIYLCLPTDDKYRKEYEQNISKLRMMMLDQIYGKQIKAQKDEKGQWYISHIEGDLIDDGKNPSHRFHAVIYNDNGNLNTFNGKAITRIKTTRDGDWKILIGLNNWFI